MRVIKRDNRYENVSFDKVLKRLQILSNDIKGVNIYEIAKKVCNNIYDGVKTRELDELAASICSSLVVDHPDYAKLASRIIISNHQKNTSPSFSETIEQLYKAAVIGDELYHNTIKNKEKLNDVINYERDYLIDYFGFKTLEKSYLLKIDKKVIERPQHMWMRVALGIHGSDIKDAINTYHLLSQKYFTHATPTLFNAGTKRNQCSSCFLTTMQDSIDGIFSTLHDCANISKYSGGIGIDVHNIRAKGSKINGTNGTSTGIVPMLRVFNNMARYVDQGSKRFGSIAVYIEPWHADIYGFLEMRKNHGNEEDRCRDLFTALWVPDLFMKRVEKEEKWSLMCPATCKGLSDTWGDTFEDLYTNYEKEGMYIKQVNARDLWYAIMEAQTEQGLPYIAFKDAINAKNNQQNLGTIRSSNLCMEINEFTSPDEIAVCNLASMCLPSYIKDDVFDFKLLHSNTKVVTYNLNKIIDKNFYPVEKAFLSNTRHRPIGIGVQGLADTFILLRMPFNSSKAKELNKMIFATIYHAAIEASIELSKIYGSYSSFEGSPISKGLFQFDLWNKEPHSMYDDWDKLRKDVLTYGIRNSLLIAPMPTASTAQIMGFNESFEPFTNNIYKRRVISGEFIVINKYLINDLINQCLWTDQMRDAIIKNDGSIQEIDIIPEDLKELYKTVWEIKQKDIIDMALDRAIYICQSQSLNIFMEEPSFKKLTSMHFYSWKNGSKIGNYYIRTRSKAKTQKFTIEPCTVCSA